VHGNLLLEALPDSSSPVFTIFRFMAHCPACSIGSRCLVLSSCVVGTRITYGEHHCWLVPHAAILSCSCPSWQESPSQLVVFPASSRSDCNSFLPLLHIDSLPCQPLKCKLGSEPEVARRQEGQLRRARASRCQPCRSPRVLCKNV
jgi:hypothetical protein